MFQKHEDLAHICPECGTKLRAQQGESGQQAYVLFCSECKTVKYERPALDVGWQAAQD
jgi:ssDNA-binding Zn-finger/Zn-ribbon topoisomerase 1